MPVGSSSSFPGGALSSRPWSCPAGGFVALPLKYYVQVALEDGAFSVVPALQGCSVVPSHLNLGSHNELTLTFTLPEEGIGATQYEERPFILRLLAPGVYLGSYAHAQNVELLASLGVTAVLNCAPSMCDDPTKEYEARVAAKRSQLGPRGLRRGAQ